MIKNLKIGSLLGACQLIEQNALANVFACSGGQHLVTQLPFIINHDNKDNGLHLYAIVANNNAICKTANTLKNLTVVFNGPNSYISPLWYEGSENTIEWSSKNLTLKGNFIPLADNQYEIMELFVQQMEDKVDRHHAVKVNLSEIVAASIAHYTVYELEIEAINEQNNYGLKEEKTQNTQIAIELKKQSNFGAMLLAFEIEESQRRKK